MAPPNGGGPAAQHSSSMYSMLAHVPGLKCVVPSDAYTAKGLLIAAIRDDDPVDLLLAPPLARHVLRRPGGAVRVPIGQARTLRAGRT